MVFKMLKGFRRLMLTTGFLFGVGLFLCGNEVLADSLAFKVDLSAGEVQIEAESSAGSSTDYSSTGIKFDVKKGGSTVFSDDSAAASPKFTYTDLDLSTLSTGDKRVIAKASLADFISAVQSSLSAGSNTLTIECTAGSGTLDRETATLDKAVYQIDKPALDTTYDTEVSSPSYTITVGSPIRSYTDTGYGFQGEGFTIKSTNVSSSNYFEYYTDGSGTTKDWYAASSDKAYFAPAGTDDANYDGTLGSDDIPKNVQYFPRISDVYFDSSLVGASNQKVYLDNTGKATFTALTKAMLKYDTESEKTKNRTVLDAKVDYLIDIIPDVNNNLSTSNQGVLSGGAMKIEFGDSTHSALSSDETPGIAKIQPLARYADGGEYKVPAVNRASVDGSGFTYTPSQPLTLTVYAYPKNMKFLQDGNDIGDTVTIVGGGTANIILKVTPGGADQDFTFVSATPVNASLFSATPSFSAGVLTLKAAATTGVTTIPVKIDAKGPAGAVSITKTLTVKIVDLDKANTTKAIKDSGKNYITIGDDFKLDLKKLVSENVRDTADKPISGKVPLVIWADSSSSSKVSLSDGGMTLKGKEAGKVTLYANFNSTSTSSTSAAGVIPFEVEVFPMPTATYVDSSRTIDLVLPRRVATSYSDDKRIDKVKGFKLILEDSSEKVLYEYDQSKFKSVVDISDSDATKKYTISASDVEAMITNAASNGKFNSDTTSVKFRIIPMGKKPGSSDVTTAKSEVNATCSSTVYRVTGSGTNFETTYAYGLDGQTVSLTATPSSGYSFKQWSDGNSSNPRSIKISGSGTRAFQAVAGERLPNAAGGANGAGGVGGDNSELYDDVPKTAESNSAIWLIIFMVFAVMGTTYALYLQLRAATSKNDK